MNRAPASLRAALLIAPACLVACAGEPERPADAAPPLPALGITARGPGAEVQSWTMPTTRRALTRALEGIDAQTPRGLPGTAQSWRESGLVALIVPAQSVPGLIQTLRAGASTSVVAGSRWLGQGPVWAEVFGAPSSAPRAVRLHDGVTALRPGQLRLLARCWSATDLEAPGAPGEVLKIELIPQLRELTDRAGDLLPAPIRVPAQQGRVFTTLRLACTLPPGSALLIAPDLPDAPGPDQLPGPDDEPSSGAQPGPRAGELVPALPADRPERPERPSPNDAPPDPARVISTPGPQPAGPGASVASLGECLLTEGPRRSVLVILPRWPTSPARSTEPDEGR